MASIDGGTEWETYERESQQRFDKILEIVAVLILGMCTLGTAWCAFEATTWSGVSSDHARESSDQRVESSRLFGLATQQMAYDSMIIAQYADAVSAGKTGLQEFYRTSLARPAFLPTLEAWQADVAAGRAPTPLSEDKKYLSAQLADYHKSVAIAEAQARLSAETSAIAGAYVSVTILLAVALFFSGIVPSFRYRMARVLLLAASLATLAVAASRLASLQVHF